MSNYLKDYIEAIRELERIISKETGLEVLLSFKSALEKAAEGVESNSLTAKQQSDAMEEVNEQVESVQKVIDRIQKIAGEMKESV